MGAPDGDLMPDAALLSGEPPWSSAASAEHPLEIARQRELSAARARHDACELTLLPRAEVVASLWARGSGLDAPSRATDLGDAAGLLPNVPNWALGLVFSYP